jgi:hypothetical protein
MTESFLLQLQKTVGQALDITTKKGIRELKSSDPVTAVVFSPDG